MANFSLDDLRVVLAAQRTGSFSRAATELGLAQPSVSSRVRQLERGLGARLFVRSRRGVHLTRAGEELATIARRILDLAEEAGTNIARAERDRSFTLGVHGTYAPAIVPKVIGILGAERLLLRIRDAHSDELVTLVASQEIDAAVVVPSPTPASVDLDLIVDDRVVCVARPDHPAIDPATRPAAMASSPLAVHAWGDSTHRSRPVPPHTTETFLALLADIGLGRRSTCWVQTASTVVTLVRDHGYLGIAPRLSVAADIERADVAVVDVEHLPRWTTPIYLASRSDRATDQFVELMRNGLPER